MEEKKRPEPVRVRPRDFSPGTYKLFVQGGLIVRGYLKGTEPPRSHKGTFVKLLSDVVHAVPDPAFPRSEVWFGDLWDIVKVEACFQVLKYQWPQRKEHEARYKIWELFVAKKEKLLTQMATQAMTFNSTRRFVE